MPGSEGARTFYDRFPKIDVDVCSGTCSYGVREVVGQLAAAIATGEETFVLECYPGVRAEHLIRGLQERIPGSFILRSEEVFTDADELQAKVNEALGNDPVFASMQSWSIDDYIDEGKLQKAQAKLRRHRGIAVVIGPGATRVAPRSDVLAYLSSTRWALQARQRAHQIGNLGLENLTDPPGLLYRNAFFLDWRVGDALRHELFSAIAWFVDLDDPATPCMVSGDVLREAIRHTARRPFRVVPFFDPGPWGGQWMREKFGLPAGPANYAWGFDCVPEENSVLFNYGGRCLGAPAQVLVAEQPEALLGEDVFREFGTEFPIRFDFLDTVGGGNLSLQVHPLRAYIQEHFGMAYTQDESYYIFDSKPGSEMFLGLRTGVGRDEFARALQDANNGGGALDAERWVNRILTRRHDHFSIPAGTVHCSGRDNVVLEISATPYIFTFKLWDWGRPGLDGKPRPVHLHHGLANIQWDRDTQWVDRELRRPVQPLSAGDGWREERTGLHSLEFLETRRHWFTGPVEHDTRNTVHVLNLVEGDSAMVESPDGAFTPMIVHYGETFIVPAAVGKYVVRPMHAAKQPLATIKAYVRSKKERNSAKQARAEG